MNGCKTDDPTPPVEVPNPEDLAMSTDPSRVIVQDGVCGRCAVPIKQVHHRDFPEIRAECGSVAEGLAYLAGLLSRAREDAGSAWHREVIDQAKADIEALLAHW